MSAFGRINEVQQFIFNAFLRVRKTAERSYSSGKQAFVLLLHDPAASTGLISSLVKRYVLTLSTLLILSWVWLLNWGEYGVFQTSIDSCKWASWEQWPTGAMPHHLVLIADPQLVDPHTYPGRPWLLSTATVAHTDLYLARTYERIRSEIEPDTAVFLGDLFDGGREWSTRSSESPEEQYHQYHNDFWQGEYIRFSNIFLRDRRTQQHNTFHTIASLPGNHDLGFASGVQVPVRDRFNAYFGDSNRIDVIGNHTFVSLDSVSLSAKDLPDASILQHIWGPTSEFLQNAHTLKHNSTRRHWQLLEEQRDRSRRPQRQVVSSISSGEELEAPEPGVPLESPLPTILLTHVPLYRAPGTPCGPKRERYPPTPPPLGQETPIEPDDRNALRVAGGYQYQNVLSREISLEIVEALQGEIAWVFSGDDHDYCEVIHRGYSSPGQGIHEITVKSISWAMGVRLPGFLLVSLWNDLDSNIAAHSGTLQTHLCLLPDQLGIFIAYAKLIALSLITLGVRAVVVVAMPTKFGPTTVRISVNKRCKPLLPTHSMSEKPLDAKKHDPSPLSSQGLDRQRSQRHSTVLTASSTLNNGSALAARTPRVSRGISPARDHAGYALAVAPGAVPARSGSLHQSYTGSAASHARNADSWTETSVTDGSAPLEVRAGRYGFAWRIILEFLHSIGLVAFCGVGWYIWLLQY